MRSGARLLLLAAAACLILGGLLLIAVYHTAPGRWIDNAALDGFLAPINTVDQRNDATVVAALCDPVPYVFFSLVITGVALIRRSPRRAAGAVALLAGSAVTTQLLKPALAQVRLDPSLVEFDRTVGPAIREGAFPSGHSTAAMALALAALLVAPRAARPFVAAVGALFALMIGFAVVALGRHYPSDIVGGYLVATAWCLVALAGIRAADVRWPKKGALRAAARGRAPSIASRSPLAAMVVLAAAGLGVALARIDQLVGFAGDHTTATVAAVLISLCAAALVAAVSVADQRAR